MKALVLVVSDQKILKIAFWKPIIWPHDLLMQLISTIWSISVGDNPRNICVEFGQISISESKENIVWTFPFKIQCKIETLGP